ncbi:hypothetical protein ONS96_012501 [Cadophora gregata f. sp. sojae]|nr:hypothetical protein ONS96_012501 [Cadophora gregata f. sp. sojae]
MNEGEVIETGYRFCRHRVLERSWAYIDLGVSCDRQNYQSRLKFFCDEFKMVLTSADFHSTSLFLNQIAVADVWQVEEFIIKYQDPQFTHFRSAEYFLPAGIKFYRGPLYLSRRQVYGKYWFMSPRFSFDSVDGKSRICVFHPEQDATHWGIGCGMKGDETGPAESDLNEDQKEEQDLLISNWHAQWMEDNQRGIRNSATN